MLQEPVDRKVFGVGMQLCLWPALHLAGLPRQMVPASLLKDALIHSWRTDFSWNHRRTGSLRQLALCPWVAHSSDEPASSSVHFYNGFQVLWHQRSLLGSSKNHHRKWKHRNALLSVGGCFHLLKGLLPSAADKTSPQDLAHQTE